MIAEETAMGREKGALLSRTRLLIFHAICLFTLVDNTDCLSNLLAPDLPLVA